VPTGLAVLGWAISLRQSNPTAATRATIQDVGISGRVLLETIDSNRLTKPERRALAEHARRLNEALSRVQRAQSYAQYYANLTSLYNILSANITWPWYFLVIPLDNTFNTGLNVDVQYQAIRSAQIDWADAKAAAGDTKVVLCCTTNDILVADTSADKIHKNASVGGYGVPAERVAQTILFLEGNVANSGLGPRITSAHWNGDATVDVTITHNGGTALQTKGGGAPTGFAASLSNATPTSGPTFTSPLTISTVAITGATTVRITLSATPASAPYIWYQWGEPGRGTTDAANGIDNALNDNRTPAINTTRGYPVVPTTTAIQSERPVSRASC